MEAAWNSAPFAGGGGARWAWGAPAEPKDGSDSIKQSLAYNICPEEADRLEAVLRGWTGEAEGCILNCCPQEGNLRRFQGRARPARIRNLRAVQPTGTTELGGGDQEP